MRKPQVEEELFSKQPAAVFDSSGYKSAHPSQLGEKRGSNTHGQVSQEILIQVVFDDIFGAHLSEPHTSRKAYVAMVYIISMYIRTIPYICMF